MTQHLDSDTVARYLADEPLFFEQHAELLSRIRLSSVLGGRTVSLQERQIEVVREKMKALELRMVDLIRIANENEAITQKLQEWSRLLLSARNDVDLPHILVNGLESIFSVPHATIRLWGVAPAFSHAWFAAEVSEDSRIFSSGLQTPFCGSNQDFEAASWLDDATSVQSIAMLPIRINSAPLACGLMVLGSPDPTRFTADMATDFLVKIADTASAAVACMLD
jgi:uncharacterized protein YigA (DUF484 family)